MDVEQTASFNLWRDDPIISFLSSHEDSLSTIDEQLDQNGGGLVEVSVSALRALVDAMRSGEVKNEDGEPYATDSIETLRRDVMFAEKKGDEYLLYSCY